MCFEEVRRLCFSFAIHSLAISIAYLCISRIQFNSKKIYNEHIQRAHTRTRFQRTTSTRTRRRRRRRKKSGEQCRVLDASLKVKIKSTKSFLWNTQIMCTLTVCSVLSSFHLVLDIWLHLYIEVDFSLSPPAIVALFVSVRPTDAVEFNINNNMNSRYVQFVE